jgi:hypothetical protein
MSTRSQITTEINLRINDNITQDITPLDVRTVLDLLNANGINYDDDVLTGNYSKNFSITRANLQTAISGSALVLKAFYLITNAVGNTRVVLVQASSANTLYAYATDVNTGAIGTYDVSTDVFTAPSGSGVAGVTGNIVDNTDPANPVITSPYTKDANDNVFFDGVTATLGSSCARNIFHQDAGGNTLGTNCVNNIFEQDANGFTFGNVLQNVTIRSENGIAGQDFSASPDYDFLYNQVSPAEIYYAGDFYHKIIDATNHLYIVTNLTSLKVYKYGVGAIPISRADLLALIAASSLIPGQAYIITDAVGSTAKIQVVAETTSALYTGAINLSASTVGSYTINSDTYTASGGGSGVASVTAGTNISITGTSTDPVINSLSDRYKTTSTTSNTIGNGSKTFTVAANLSYIPLQEVLVVFDSSNHMHGAVTSYSGTTLIVDIKHHTGSGTYTSWVINLDGTPVDAITGSGTAGQLAEFSSAGIIQAVPLGVYAKTEEAIAYAYIFG